MIFSKYGDSHTQPLDLSVGTEGDILTSINLQFPTATKEFTLIIPNTVKYIKQNAFLYVKNVKME